jgi:hypothetical protein
MNLRDEKIYKDLLTHFKNQWDKNQYARTNYDSDLEYYRGYINTSTYPLVYNTSFNRILPIVYTILSRFMDQLYQSGNIVSVKPRRKQDIERAKLVEGILNYQLETLNNIDMQGGSFLTNMKWMFNAITFGKGIVKCYWKKEERITPRRIALPVPNFDKLGNFQGMDTLDYVSQESKPIYDAPYMEVLHNKLFVPHPEYKNIQQMPYVFCVYRRSLDYIKRMADKGIYKNLKDLGHEAGGYASAREQDYREAFIKSLTLENGLHTENANTKTKTTDMDILECYGKMILEDEPYEVGSGVKIKGKEEEIIAHIGNWRALLSLQRNPYGIRPFFDMGCYYHPELYWDLGMVLLTKNIQDHVNDLANLRIQNAMMMINPMLKVNMDSEIDPSYLVWKPFGLVPVTDMNDIEPLTIQDTNQNLFLEQERFYKDAIQDIMGMYDYNMGQTPTRQERVGVVYGIQSMGEARAKLLLMSMDHLGFRPLLSYMMLLNTFHLPSGFEFRIGDGDMAQFGKVWGEDISPDFDFAARYTAMEPPLGKQYRAQQLVQMAGLWAENPWINQYQWNKTLMELLDVRETDYLLKTPQQFQQEMESQAQMQMMAEQMKKRWDAEGKIAKSVTDAKGRMALQEQKSQTDLAIAAIQAETMQDRASKASNE